MAKPADISGARTLALTSAPGEIHLIKSGEIMNSPPPAIENNTINCKIAREKNSSPPSESLVRLNLTVGHHKFSIGVAKIFSADATFTVIAYIPTCILDVYAAIKYRSALLRTATNIAATNIRKPYLTDDQYTSQSLTLLQTGSFPLSTNTQPLRKLAQNEAHPHHKATFSAQRLVSNLK